MQEKTVYSLRTGEMVRRAVSVSPEAFLRYCKIALTRAKAGRAVVCLDSVSLRIYTDEVFAELTNPLR